ncbi:MAG: hypothetical protein A2Y38_21085 [Spirochaetes bacterium GWB1_59_5]|nr:MAG: hypothetical protein A2Y38_21085 [Spirochaetes bacterium GWB1_59_5]
MNSMERIGAVLSGGVPDRRPFTLTLSLYGARLAGVSAVDYFADPALYAAGQKAVVDLCEPDIVFGPFALALEAEAYGALVERFSDAPPLVKNPAFKSALDIESITRPEPESDPRLRFLVDSVRAVVQDQHGTRPVAAPITAPCDLPVLLLGMDQWLETLLFKPELAAQWGRLATEHFEALATAYFTAGASFLVSPVMLANPAIIHPELADRTILPILKDAFGRSPGPIVFHHGGNRLSRSLDQVKDLPNIAGFVVDERDALAVSRRTLGAAPLLLGNLSGPHFAHRHPADIANRTVQILRDREADVNFILASSNADIPYDTDPDCVVAVRRAVEAF